MMPTTDGSQSSAPSDVPSEREPQRFRLYGNDGDDQHDSLGESDIQAAVAWRRARRTALKDLDKV